MSLAIFLAVKRLSLEASDGDLTQMEVILNQVQNDNGASSTLLLRSKVI
ncbi:hypothetical protein GKN94_07295 [Candidatus Lucifugimonas marina]|uniref:Uncharacterized protein n=1 Tax=Candidatus Lucifugimonas marina TaxID=3038979 RepID=A0AAJ5ZIQ2_9CHLR|nr:hypothetical protein GKN94_07295 [SAR202 cluster bacterium JH545]WFG39451.1 hypothetical protein GKO48_07410 [SAR202 cluster bacterium JH1073]